MKELLNLTGYEYKKIFQKKSTWIALAVVLLWVLFSGVSGMIGDYYIDEEKADSHYHMIKQEIEALEHLEVKELNQEFFQKGQEDLAEFSKNQEELRYNWENTENKAEYWKKYYKAYAPYCNLDTLLIMMGNHNIDIEGVDGTNFYEYRSRMMENIFQGEKLSEEEIAFHEKENEKINTPYAYGNMLGFDNYFQMQTPNFIFLAFAVAIILAPMFAGERTSHMDALVLSSRYGKNKLIWAKLLTGISFAVFAALGFSIICLLEMQTVYGLSGWNLPIQVTAAGFYLNLPVNLLEFLGITAGCCLSATCMTAMIVMFCSAKMKTAFGVIIVCFVFIFAPIFLVNMVGEFRFLYMLVCSLPTAMYYPRSVAAHQLLSVGNHYFYFFQWVPVVYLFLTAGLAVWSYRSFKNHQIQ
ncbi:hypothetical protein E5329_13595 [Petralouisia muris]|uniref:Uncharacterized protein n=1 Tax=Petralouisia muris TaxID=3032872 RepID=A0AC61RVD4_9FIRM|nr:ABC transporter permease subunit [Petralouisia muris]TGY95610.1 hypothetical protein E5329_13595 [Petralouisia muris]